MFKKSEMQQVQTYFRKLFSNENFFLKEGTGKDAPAEVLLGGQFIGVVYKNEDEGEVSYDFNMAILPEDLEE
ncbi:MAG: DUF3126 family protein [Alphaproteobacteria bacterium]|nr:DUF3126 family protein [Alphaproteobacteria bacterium]